MTFLRWPQFSYSVPKKRLGASQKSAGTSHYLHRWSKNSFHSSRHKPNQWIENRRKPLFRKSCSLKEKCQSSSNMAPCLQYLGEGNIKYIGWSFRNTCFIGRIRIVAITPNLRVGHLRRPQYLHSPSSPFPRNLFLLSRRPSEGLFYRIWLPFYVSCPSKRAVRYWAQVRTIKLQG